MRNGLLLSCLGFVLTTTVGAAPRSWELREGGRWQEVASPATRPVKDETLDQVEDLIHSRQYSAAHKLVVGWLADHPSSPVRDRGLYLLGEINFRDGDRILAFYNFDELLDRHPGGAYAYAALERQYDIADAYLSGRRDSFLGLRIIARKDEAIEMLWRIQQRAPGSPVAEKALLRTADHYDDSQENELAADAYAAYVRAYPRSPNVPRVRLKRAFAVLREFRGAKFSATPLIDAKQQLIDLRAAYPDLAQKENVDAVLIELDEMLAAKGVQTGDFYRRTHEPRAAAYWYAYVIRTYPGTAQAARAREALEDIPAAQRTPTTSSAQ
jgi:outer membrane assembly lipoprotein YfiO